MNWCVVALVLVVAYDVCYRVPLSELPADPALAKLHIVSRSVGMLLLVVSALSAVLIVAVSIALMRDRDIPGRYIGQVGFAFFTPFIGYVIISMTTWPMHRSALTRVEQRAAPLVAAIEAYTSEAGEPPASLAALSPKYLAVVPGTSLAAYPAFLYTRFSTKTARRTLWWYDLGARHGRTVTTNWEYPDGDTAHAILALELDGEGRVVSAKADRMASEPSLATFTRADWDRKPIDRQAMVADFQHRFPLDGRAADDVKQLLGQPDGTRVLVSSPWELYVRTWPNDVDKFCYWPTHAYPTVLDTKTVTRVGNWAYLRD